MFNAYLAEEEAKQHIERRMQEAETHRLHKQLGYTDQGAAPWVVAIIALIVGMAIGLLP